MENKISSAFTYMFKDSDWRYKMLILGLFQAPMAVYYAMYINLSKASNMIPAWLMNPSIGVLVLIISIIFMLFSSGYWLRCIQSIMNLNPIQGQDLLPSWEDNFGSYTKISLKFVSAYIVAGLILWIPFLLVIPQWIFGIIFPALVVLFCREQNLMAFLRWGKAFKLIGNNRGLYFGCLLAMILSSILFALVYIPITFYVSMHPTSPLATNYSTIYVFAILIDILSVYFSLVSAGLIGLIGRNCYEESL